MSWTTKSGEDVSKRFKKFVKRWPREVKNVFDNLDTLLIALGAGTRPEQLKKLGFVRSGPTGILEIDETGPGKGTKMKALRLYVFPDERTQSLYVLTLGDKQSQPDDVKHCQHYVRGLLDS